MKLSFFVATVIVKSMTIEPDHVAGVTEIIIPPQPALGALECTRKMMLNYLADVMRDTEAQPAVQYMCVMAGPEFAEEVATLGETPR